MAVYLISEKDLKETTLNDNVDPCYLENAMDLAQNVGLHQIIGTKLLNKLVELVEKGLIKNPENIDYKVLLNDYIYDYLKWQTMSELTLLIAYKYRNAGVVTTGDEHNHESTMTDAQYMKRYYEDKANFFAIRINKYLRSNTSKYPEYSCNSKCDEIGGGDMNFNTGIYLG